MIVDFQVLQESVGKWAEKNFGIVPPEHILLGVAEEVGELCHDRLKFIQGIRSRGGNEADCVGDIVIYLLHYCHATGISFNQAVADTWRIVEKRDWKKFPTNGVIA